MIWKSLSLKNVPRERNLGFREMVQYQRSVLWVGCVKMIFATNMLWVSPQKMSWQWNLAVKSSAGHLDPVFSLSWILPVAAKLDLTLQIHSSGFEWSDHRILWQTEKNCVSIWKDFWRPLFCYSWQSSGGIIKVFSKKRELYKYKISWSKQPPLLFSMYNARTSDHMPPCKTLCHCPVFSLWIHMWICPDKSTSLLSIKEEIKQRTGQINLDLIMGTGWIIIIDSSFGDHECLHKK